MAKATTTITPPASGVNRRGLLRCAGGLAAGSALSVLPLAQAAAGSSPEFLEYQRCYAAWLATFDTPYEKDPACRARNEDCNEARWETINVLLERAPRSWQDVVELAHVVRMELWDTDDDDNWHPHSEHGELEPALLKAIFAVAEGGANV
jgi:hypothetical protein